MLLEAELLAALERMQLRSRRPLAGLLSGGHRSKRHGSSLDFADFREYLPGDDFRRIDYLTLARLDQLVVRLYESDDDLTVDLIVDTSASMGLDSKLRRACEIAAAVGFVAMTRRDTVRLHVAGAPPRRFTGRHGFAQLDAALSALSAGGELSLAETATRVLGSARPPGLTVLCSDMLDDDWASAVRRLPALGADVVVMQILGAGELNPDALGDVDLVDIETGDRVPVSMTRHALDEYQTRLASWREEVRSLVRSRGALLVDVDSRQPIREILLENLRQAEAFS